MKKKESKKKKGLPHGLDIHKYPLVSNKTMWAWVLEWIEINDKNGAFIIKRWPFKHGTCFAMWHKSRSIFFYASMAYTKNAKRKLFDFLDKSKAAISKKGKGGFQRRIL